MIFYIFQNNLYLLYPALVIIPVCFVVDIVVKATCYAALFLTPEVTISVQLFPIIVRCQRH